MTGSIITSEVSFRSEGSRVSALLSRPRLPSVKRPSCGRTATVAIQTP